MPERDGPRDAIVQAWRPGTATPDGGLAVAGNARPGVVRRFSHEAMATIFEVHAVHADPQYLAQAAHETFSLVDRLERDLSRFVPNSDIARVNRLEAGDVTRVAADTMECLIIARHLFDLTSGAFDVSIGTGLPSLSLDADTCVVQATAGGVRIDLGGIGKGYAVDRMGELLEEWGVGQALVHGGFSSVLALEPPPDSDGWAVVLSDPADGARRASLSVSQTALSASGLRKGGHIRDPRTGLVVSGRRAAWVALPRPRTSPDDGPPDAGLRFAAAAVADALTTAAMVLPVHEVAALCALAPGLEVWILPDGPGGGTDGGLVHVAAPG